MWRRQNGQGIDTNMLMPNPELAKVLLSFIDQDKVNLKECALMHLLSRSKVM